MNVNPNVNMIQISTKISIISLILSNNNKKKKKKKQQTKQNRCVYNTILVNFL